MHPPPASGPAGLHARGLCLAYDGQTVVHHLDLEIPPGRFTAIIGANASGKSTLLRGLARLLRPTGGQVLLDGHDIHTLATRELAMRLGMLPQQPVAPEGITVADLVGRGRHPHQSWLRRWSPEDDRSVAAALAATGITDLADRSVDELSGGQRQRVWIALALAQETEVLLLDEPTTFLDLAHQLDVLDLLDSLPRDRGRTVVAVLHDLTLAARYADHLLAVHHGRVAARGRPEEVLTRSLLAEVFGLDAEVIPDPLTGTPLVIPVPRGTRADRGLS